MSLINQMLQELDARGSESGRSGSVYANVRAVPESRKNYLAWGIAVVAAMLAGGAASWLWLRTTTMPVQVPLAELPLKLSSDLRVPSALQSEPPPMSAESLESRTAAALECAAEPVSASAAAIAETRDVPENLATEEMQQSRPTSSQTGQSEAKVAAAVVVPAASKPVKQVQAKSFDNPASVNLAKEVKELTPQQRAENEYRRASTLVSQGRVNDAVAMLEQALQFDPQHAAARQTLVGLLVEGKRPEEAMRKLQEGLALDVHQVGMAMILARLQVEKNDIKTAVETLQRSLPYAGDRADYLAFLAALEQRQGRHKDAIEHYVGALRIMPQNAVWLMGIGISLQAENRLAEARDAFTRAKAANTLSAELQAFVEQKLAQLPR